VVSKAQELVRWVGDRIPGGFRMVQRAASLYMRLALAPIRLVITVIGNVIDAAGKVPGKLRSMRDAISGMAETILRPFRTLLSYINDIIDRIKNIKLPKIDLNPLNRVAAAPAGPGGGSSGGGDTYNVTIGGVVDERTARALATTLANINRRTGA
jgi:hypothetical protein